MIVQGNVGNVGPNPDCLRAVWLVLLQSRCFQSGNPKIAGSIPGYPNNLQRTLSVCTLILIKSEITYGSVKTVNNS